MKDLSYEKDKRSPLQNLGELKEDLKAVNVGSIVGFQKLKSILKENNIKLENEKPNSPILDVVIEITKTINERFENAINSNLNIYKNAYKHFDYFVTKYNIKPYLSNKTSIRKDKRESLEFEDNLKKYNDYILNKKYYDCLKRK
ncbi:MAG: Cfr10I/Bse634I family restriction endonuclease [Candidatus Marsarchaeota archaeon]|jgi:hypothetical protein|nr:Cfr10I/Bse634I family restriction endonuclease [Candidatus Marsarchaeota archaeon]